MTTRRVNVEGEGYQCARRYMIRLEKRDLIEPARLSSLAAQVKLTPEAFRDRLMALVDVREIELADRVVFVGPNNSGKTSALQALALWDIGAKRWVEIWCGDGAASVSVPRMSSPNANCSRTEAVSGCVRSSSQSLIKIASYFSAANSLAQTVWSSCSRDLSMSNNRFALLGSASEPWELAIGGESFLKLLLAGR